MLLVKDAQLRRALHRATTDHGYDPWVIGDPGEAIKQSAGYGPQLCVIDLSSDGLNAEMALADQLLDQNPQARLILVVDQADAAPISKLPEGAVRLLLRPFAMLEFMSAVDDALNPDRVPSSRE